MIDAKYPHFLKINSKIMGLNLQDMIVISVLLVAKHLFFKYSQWAFYIIPVVVIFKKYLEGKSKRGVYASIIAHVGTTPIVDWCYQIKRVRK